MKKILIILAMVSLLGACTDRELEQNPVDLNTKEITKSSIIDDTPEQFENNMQGSYLLLDVREPEEYQARHIDDALLIPVGQLASRIDEIDEYKDATVLVYCRSGNRSVTAANILIDNGFKNVHNLSTGINGWTEYKVN